MSHLYSLQNDHHQKLVTIHHHTIGSFCPLTPHPLPLWEPPLTSAVSGVTNILNLSITHSPSDLMMNTIKVGVSEVIIFCVLPSCNTQKWVMERLAFLLWDPMDGDSLVSAKGWYLTLFLLWYCQWNSASNSWTSNMPAFSESVDDSARPYPCLPFSLAPLLLQI